MADQLIDTSQLIFDRIDITSLNQLHHKKTFGLHDMTQIHTINPNIVGKTQIGIDGLMPDVGKAKSGCAFTADNVQVPLIEKEWDPQDFEIPLSQCVDNLDTTFWKFMAAAGHENPDLKLAEGFQAWFAQKFDYAAKNAVWRHIWFGDTAVANYNDSPAGTLTNGVSETLYNVINGFWKQLFTIGTASSDRYTEISENSEASYSAQALAAGKAQTIFESLRDNADDRLYDDDSAFILCTKSMAQNYAKSLRGVATESSYKRIEGGYQALEFDGVPVIPIPFWDRQINAAFNNGTVRYRPHRAVYINKENLNISLDKEDSFGSYDEWYSKDNGEYRARALWKMDAKIFDDEAVQLAY